MHSWKCLVTWKSHYQYELRLRKRGQGKSKEKGKGKMRGRVIGSWLPFWPGGPAADARGCVMALHAM